MTVIPFEAQFQVTWADLDSNDHMANSRYLDYASQTRFLFLDAQGFSPRDFAEHGMGPVVFEDTVRYRRELRFLEKFKVTYTLAGQSADSAKFVLTNRVSKLDGTLSAEIVSTGGWFDLRARRIAPPPPALRAAMDALAREPDFREL